MSKRPHQRIGLSSVISRQGAARRPRVKHRSGMSRDHQAVPGYLFIAIGVAVTGRLLHRLEWERAGFRTAGAAKDGSASLFAFGCGMEEAETSETATAVEVAGAVDSFGSVRVEATFGISATIAVGFETGRSTFPSNGRGSTREGLRRSRLPPRVPRG